MPERRSRRRRRRRTRWRQINNARRRRHAPPSDANAAAPAPTRREPTSDPQNGVQPENTSEAARIRTALLSDPARRNTDIVAELGAPVSRVGEVRYLLTRDRQIHKFGYSREHLAECWCQPGDVISDADRVRAALLEDETQPNAPLSSGLKVPLGVVARCREELLQQKLIHRYTFARFTVHSARCWCGGSPPPGPAEDGEDDDEQAVPRTIERPWAVVTWREHTMQVLASYYPSRETAERAAPHDDTPYTIVDITTRPRGRLLE